MATSTVEQYVKIIYHLQQRTDGRVQTQHIADRLNITPGTATVMIKHLAQSGLVDYMPRQGVVLSEEGATMALRLLRYHRLIETFLVQVVGYDWSEIHEEAEVLEHAVSERFIQKIDQLLGYPSHDPHGDPIPGADGAIQSIKSISIPDMTPGMSATICRFHETSPETLELMTSKGLGIGTPIEFIQESPAAGTLTIRGPQGEFTMGRELACTIRVQVD